MKKLIIIAAIAVFGLTSVQAQDNSFGIKAGVNLANMGGDFENTDTRTGFHVGILTEQSFISGRLNLVAEFAYSVQGLVEEDSELKLDYFNTSLYGKYYIAQGLSIDAGFYAGLLASAKLDDEDVKDAFTEYDLGLLVGPGYKLSNGLFIQGRYNLSLLDVLKSDDIKATNEVIQVSLGYMF